MSKLKLFSISLTIGGMISYFGYDYKLFPYGVVISLLLMNEVFDLLNERLK